MKPVASVIKLNGIQFDMWVEVHLTMGCALRIDWIEVRTKEGERVFDGPAVHAPLSLVLECEKMVKAAVCSRWLGEEIEGLNDIGADKPR